MNSVIFCILLAAPFLSAFTIPKPQKQQSIQPHTETPVQTAQTDHNINKRFAGLTAMMLYGLMDNDDYYDDLVSMRRGRPSRRTIQLAQMIRQLAGTQGLTRGQLQNMQQNLQNLQAMQNVQQLLQTQNLQGVQPVAQAQQLG